MPDNDGERRECLIILEKVDWLTGLIKSLATDPEVSICTTRTRPAPGDLPELFCFCLTSP